FSLTAGGSLPLWLGFAAAGIGMFLSLFARRLLIIRTSDGARTVLPAGSDEIAAQLVLRIRQAIEAAGVASSPALLPHIAQSEQPGIPVRTAPPQALPQHPAQIAAAPARREPYANGHARTGLPATNMPESLPFGDPGHAPRQTTMPLGQHAAAPGRLQTAPPERRFQMAPPAQSEPIGQLTAREPLALPATGAPTGPPRDDAPHDLATLIDHVRRADVQHKEALLDLLRVVDDYYRGKASREDAVAHWRSFADYVIQYLSDVDGLIAHTERFGRHMLAR
ncbi:MAG: hypothetical protein JSS20_22125, partial [Proteobacteria bacterium]|nr:hypothetical protein [Pseudomonadota bacterium]